MPVVLEAAKVANHDADADGTDRPDALPAAQVMAPLGTGGQPPGSR